MKNWLIDFTNSVDELVNELIFTVVHTIETIARALSKEIFAFGKTGRSDITLVGSGQRVIQQFMATALAFSCTDISRLFHDTNIYQRVCIGLPLETSKKIALDLDQIDLISISSIVGQAHRTPF